MIRPLLLVLVLTGCLRSRPVPEPVVTPVVVTPTPAPLSDWPVTLATATRAADAGDYARADQLLLAHGVRHAGTPEGAEADFWRAVFRADPSNSGASLRDRIALFDAYLSPAAQAPRYVEATVMRRMLEATDSVAAVLETVRANTTQRLRAREEEIRKLTDELDRTVAELERIKKRLAPGRVP